MNNQQRSGVEFVNVGKRLHFKVVARLSAICLLIALSSCVVGMLLSVETFFNAIGRTMHSRPWSATVPDSLVQINEEMTFEASYLFLKIGSIRFQVLGKTEYDSSLVYHLRAYIDSYNGIPFVDFHSVYETYADAKTLFCTFNSRSQKDGKNWIYTTTVFNFDKKKITWEQMLGGDTIRKIDLPLDMNYTNGVSFVYYLRMKCREAAGQRMQVNVPITDDTVQSFIHMAINENKEPCDVTAFDFPLDAYRLDGHLDFIGTFGISGDFEGWMAADSSSVPLKAKIKLLLGNVVVQLKDIKRRDWMPPRASDE